MTTFVDIVFSQPPGPTSDFVEVEDDAGCGLSFGTWTQRQDGYWVLRITRADVALLLPSTDRD